MRRAAVRTIDVLGAAWLALLSCAVAVAAKSAYERVLAVPEHAWGCDAFGYLRMAREIREAAHDARLPDFAVHARQTDLLVALFRERGLPEASWGELVAPHAHHYFARAGHVACQYPPGTALALAAFPEGRATHGVSLVVLAAIVLATAVGLATALRRRAWLAAGGVALAAELGLDLVADMGPVSFSITVMIVPLLACVACALGAARERERGRRGRAVALAFVAGAALGAATLVRLPIAVLAPGVLVLLSLRGADARALLAFAAGGAAFGVAPLLVHQARVAGAWYLPTYSALDATSPAFGVVRANVAYYLAPSGAGARYEGALVAAALGAIGLGVAAGATRAAGAVRTRRHDAWLRLGAAALAIWGASTAYFLTHAVTTAYYQLPATFTVVVALAAGALALDDPRDHPAGRTARALVALVLAAAPGATALAHGASLRESAFGPASAAPEAPPHTLTLPPDLGDERAWVLADFLTGPLWYYAHKPAFKATFGDAASRALLVAWVRSRGEPLYVVKDSPFMQPVLDEIAASGASLEERGAVDGSPYYVVRW